MLMRRFRLITALLFCGAQLTSAQFSIQIGAKKWCSFPLTSDQSSTSAHFTKDGRFLDVGFKNTVRRYDSETLEYKKSIFSDHGDHSWSSFRALADGDHFMWKTSSNATEIRNLETGELVSQVKEDVVLDFVTEDQAKPFLAIGSKDEVTFKMLGAEENLWTRKFLGKRVRHVSKAEGKELFAITTMDEPGNKPWTGDREVVLVHGLLEPKFISVKVKIPHDRHFVFCAEGSELQVRLSLKEGKEVVRYWSTTDGSFLREEREERIWPRDRCGGIEHFQVIKVEDRLEIVERATGILIFRSPRFGINARISNPRFSPTGDKMVLISKYCVRVWRTADWTEIGDHVGKPGHRSPVISHAYSLDGKYLATGELAGRMILWDAKTHEKIWEFVNEGCSWGIENLSFSPDGRFLVRYTRPQPSQNTLSWHLHDVTTGKEVWKIPAHYKAFSPLFSADGKRLYGFLSKTGIQEWDIESGKLLRKIETEFNQSLKNGDHLTVEHLSWPVSGEKAIWLYSETHGRRLQSLAGEIISPVTDAWEAIAGPIDEPLMDNLRKRASFADPLTLIPPGSSTYLDGGSDDRIADISGGGYLLMRKDGVSLADQFSATAFRKLGRFYPVDGVPTRASLGFSSDDRSILITDGRGVREHSLAGFSNGLDKKENEVLWRMMGFSDEVLAAEATFELLTRQNAADFLELKLDAVSPPIPGLIQFLKEGLNDDDHQVRVVAARRLLDLGENLSREEVQKTATPIEHFSIAGSHERRIPGIDFSTSSDHLPFLKPLSERSRASRAIYILEMLVSERAKETLMKIARGYGGSPITLEARLALLRIDGKR